MLSTESLLSLSDRLFGGIGGGTEIGFDFGLKIGGEVVSDVFNCFSSADAAIAASVTSPLN